MAKTGNLEYNIKIIEHSRKSDKNLKKIKYYIQTEIVEKLGSTTLQIRRIRR